jgi:hypothetical protein
VQKTFISEGAGVNADDIADPKKKIIKFSGTLDDHNYRVSQPNANAEMYMNVISQKVNQMRETSGNNDVMSGNTPSGITAASAIAALQEQAGKTSRNAIKASYRVFTRMCKIIIELIREFYDTARVFRIVGEGGGRQYATFSNKDMAPHTVQRLDGTVIEAEPVFDIVVSAQKSSPYASMAQNELALQFYNAGFFDPSRADMVLATLEMMDFKDKDKIIARISQNGTMYQMLQILTERLAKAEAMLGISQQMNSGAKSMSPGGKAEMPEQNEEGVVSEESSVTKKARERSAQSTIPR